MFLQFSNAHYLYGIYISNLQKLYMPEIHLSHAIYKILSYKLTFLTISICYKSNYNHPPKRFEHIDMYFNIFLYAITQLQLTLPMKTNIYICYIVWF